MARDCALITSLTSEQGLTQASSAYLATALAMADWRCEVTDLSGIVEYHSGPEDLYTSDDSPLWLSPRAIMEGDWMDSYLPHVDAIQQELVLFSALFSPDLVFHARLSYLIRLQRPTVTTAIGGAALAGLRDDQLKLVAIFFDFVLVGHDVNRLLGAVLSTEGLRVGTLGKVVRATRVPDFDPDYSIVPLKDFVSVYTGHGCYYGKCRFCDYPVRASADVTFRQPERVAADLAQIYRLRPTVKDIVLTQDSYTRKHLTETAQAIARLGRGVPYNLMFRAEPWVSAEIGQLLANSGCTDVFIGAEAFDDEILGILDKGVNARAIASAIRVLSEYVKVAIGLILFVPGIASAALARQQERIMEILPYVDAIEPEVLTVVNGSGFALQPERFGIILNATERVLNDSWCFGLSQDIPWTMADRKLGEDWIVHTRQLKDICGNYVAARYWKSMDEAAERFVSV